MMRPLRRACSRVLDRLLRRHHDSDLVDEFESHLQLMTDDLVARGVPAAEARRRAALQFGSIESAKESYRDQRRLPVVDTLVQDVRYALRGFRRNPGFAAVAVLSLAIGIGANTAIFSIVNTVLIRPLEYAEPDRIFAAREFFPELGGLGPVNPTHPLEWAAQCPSLDQVALMRGGRAQLTGGGEPLSVPALQVSPNILSLLGVAPVAGRAFFAGQDEAAADSIVIISEQLWRSRFNGDPLLVGRHVKVDGRDREVVGILPEWFRPPYTGSSTRFDVFVPLVLPPQERARLTGNYNYAAVVRLRRGVTVERALAEINAVQSQIPRRAGSNREVRAALIPVHELMTDRARVGLWMLAAAVGSVLLIVCVNLANLLLARMSSRAREAGIRAALGAGRGRLVVQVLTESVLLSLAGGGLGVMLARWSVRFLVAATTLDIPRLDRVQVDSTMLVFALALAFATGLVFGLLPAWRFTRDSPQDALRGGGRAVTDTRGGMRLREVLIGLEVALSAALLIVAGLLITSLTRLMHVDKGFETQHVLTIDLRLAGGAYDDAANQGRFYDRVLATISALRGVEASGIVTSLPVRGESWNDPIYLEGGTRHPVNNRYASPGYFSAMNIAVRKGRAFDESDRDRGVAVLSEKAAAMLWPGEADPIGRRFMGEDDKIKTLVGIVADVRASLRFDAPATAYYPYWQRVPAGATLVVRSRGAAQAVASEVRGILRAENPELPIPAVQTMDEVVDQSVAQRRFQARLMAAFAASALLVASLGIYGVVSYSVARRKNEIAIRLALGALPSRVLSLVFRQGLMPVGLGLAAGIAAAIALGSVIRGLLFEVQPFDAPTIAIVSTTLLAVGAIACIVPARRAASTDALSVVRIE